MKAPASSSSSIVASSYEVVVPAAAAAAAMTHTARRTSWRTMMPLALAALLLGSTTMCEAFIATSSHRRLPLPLPSSSNRRSTVATTTRPAPTTSLSLFPQPYFRHHDSNNASSSSSCWRRRSTLSNGQQQGLIRSASSALFASRRPDDLDNEEVEEAKDKRKDDEKQEDATSLSDSSSQKDPSKQQRLFKYKLPSTTNKALIQLLMSMKTLWNRIKWYLLTFSTGAVFAITALVVPLVYYHSEDNYPLSQPVTLFETILSDLQTNYVDEVNANELFETGISAMLNSLDPYTEFENLQQAQDMTESIEGKYGGVGLVIATKLPNTNKNNNGQSQQSQKATPIIQNQINPIPQSQPPQLEIRNINDMDDAAMINDGTIPIADQQQQSPQSTPVPNNLNKEEDPAFSQSAPAQSSSSSFLSNKKNKKKQENSGVRVVSAFEGYAFDYGMRVGDKLVQVDDTVIDTETKIEQVRNTLRGEPGTYVTIRFERDGVDDIQSITMPRSIVQIRDVKLATLLGNPKDGIGYIQLSGFASDAGREVRNAITYLQRSTEDANNNEKSLQALILDLRGNPGGLLTSAVDVSSLLVPKGSDIVSATGRGFPGILYRSRVDPILDPNTKLAVLVNSNTASAAEIVSGAVQDLDVGIIVGADRTFGKGLVQNVEELPYNTALKFTVAKYYTPSGRCIQGLNYNRNNGNNAMLNGDGDDDNGNGKRSSYIATKIDEQDRETFYTRSGRVVRDGGGIEADYKVPAQKASVLEVTLLRAGILSDFAAEWSKQHELTNNFQVDEDTYQEFQNFVQARQKSGELELESLYSKPLSDLKKALKASGYKGSEKSVEQLQARIVRDIQNDFQKYKTELKEDISQNILARYLPESMLIERGVQKDPQVQEAIKLVSSKNQFDQLLAQGSATERGASGGGSAAILASSSQSKKNVAAQQQPQEATSKEEEWFRKTIQW